MTANNLAIADQIYEIIEKCRKEKKIKKWSNEKLAEEANLSVDKVKAFFRYDNVKQETTIGIVNALGFTVIIGPSTKS